MYLQNVNYNFGRKMGIQCVNYFDIEFEWDKQKRTLNLAKHFIDFEDVKDFFTSPYLISKDERFNYGEERHIA